MTDTQLIRSQVRVRVLQGATHYVVRDGFTTGYVTDNPDLAELAGVRPGYTVSPITTARDLILLYRMRSLNLLSPSLVVGLVLDSYYPGIENQAAVLSDVRAYVKNQGGLKNFKLTISTVFEIIDEILRKRV